MHAFAERRTNIPHLWLTDPSGLSKRLVVPRTDICPKVTWVTGSSTFSESDLASRMIAVTTEIVDISRLINNCWVMVSACRAPSCFYPTSRTWSILPGSLVFLHITLKTWGSLGTRLILLVCLLFCTTIPTYSLHFHEILFILVAIIFFMNIIQTL